MYSNGPIIACSTNAHTPSAINLLRLSGFESFGPIEPLFSISLDSLKPRYAHYCNIIDGEEVIDDVLLTYFPAPHSYNGENILEISVHGNPFNTQRIIDLFIKKSGFEYAKPGEFSYRALRNKKMNLSQIEGLDLMLNASGKYMLEQGRSFLSGNLYKLYQSLHKNFINHRSSLELLTDFSEDVGDEAAKKNLNESFIELRETVSKLKSRVEGDHTQIINSEIALVGQPNSGKSTLFNSLLNENRAIVTDIAGTTRDSISEKIKIGEQFYRLTDTAGIRDSSNSIEKMGIERSVKIAHEAFYKVLVVNPLEWTEEYHKKIAHISYDYLIITHKDNAKFKELLAPIEPKLPKIGRLVIGIENKEIKNIDSINLVEFKYNSKQFQEFTSSIMSKMLKLQANQPILLERHKRIINNLHQEIESYTQVISSENDLGILASHVQILDKNISELIGIISPNDVLHHIFTNFCIGK